MLRHLRMLGESLAAMGIRGEVIIAGGAAMCLAHGARLNTRGTDSLCRPEGEVTALIAKIARENGLDSDWLNDSCSIFMQPDPPKEKFLSLKGLTVFTVAPRYLLAMKLLAGWGEPDI